MKYGLQKDLLALSTPLPCRAVIAGVLRSLAPPSLSPPPPGLEAPVLLQAFSPPTSTTTSTSSASTSLPLSPAPPDETLQTKPRRPRRLVSGPRELHLKSMTCYCRPVLLADLTGPSTEPTPALHMYRTPQTRWAGQEGQHGSALALPTTHDTLMLSNEQFNNIKAGLPRQHAKPAPTLPTLSSAPQLAR